MHNAPTQAHPVLELKGNIFSLSDETEMTLVSDAKIR